MPFLPPLEVTSPTPRTESGPFYLYFGIPPSRIMYQQLDAVCIVRSVRTKDFRHDFLIFSRRSSRQ